jgi:hypothetical protein
MSKILHRRVFFLAILLVLTIETSYLYYESTLSDWTIVDSLLANLSHNERNFDMRSLLPDAADNFTSQPGVHHPYLVPNIVHFIWFGKNRNLTFINYISIRSAHDRQKPERILLHCDHLPVGPWWERLQSEVAMEIVHKTPPTHVGSQPIGFRYGFYHQADVAKLEVLMAYGGIYLDCDVIVINTLDPLRIYEMAIGREKLPKLIMGSILANKNARFLKVWYDTYAYMYRPMHWDYNTGTVSFYMFTRRPDLIHVEPFRLSTPDWTDRHLLFDGVIKWQDFYVLHVMTNHMQMTFTPDNIRQLDSTFGQVMRLVYYGSPALLT